MYIIYTMILLFAGIQTVENIAYDRYTVLDGSGNKYEITPGKEPKLVYSPVKPENSSSGMYSGGDPVNKTITQEQFVEFEKLFTAGITNKKIRMKDRVKGSYALIPEINGKQKYILIQRDCKEREELEAYLKQLLVS